VVAKRYEEMKAILIDGECVGAKGDGVAYCDVPSCISFVTAKENATHFVPCVYLRSTLATVRAWSLLENVFLYKFSLNIGVAFL
jgi:hypothetical protein